MLLNFIKTSFVLLFLQYPLSFQLKASRIFELGFKNAKSNSYWCTWYLYQTKKSGTFRVPDLENRIVIANNVKQSANLHIATFLAMTL